MALFSRTSMSAQALPWASEAWESGFGLFCPRAPAHADGASGQATQLAGSAAGPGPSVRAGDPPAAVPLPSAPWHLAAPHLPGDSCEQGPELPLVLRLPLRRTRLRRLKVDQRGRRCTHRKDTCFSFPKTRQERGPAGGGAPEGGAGRSATLRAGPAPGIRSAAPRKDVLADSLSAEGSWTPTESRGVPTRSSHHP